MTATSIEAAARTPSRGKSIEHSQPIQRSRRRTPLCFAALAIGLVVTFVLAIVLGSVRIPLNEVVSILLGGEAAQPAWRAIVEDIRLPRAITAVLAGSALGIAGLQMQTLFRNPLADPFVLGISSGASLGVALVVLAGGAGMSVLLSGQLGVSGDMVITAAAVIGAACVLGPVLLLSSRVAHPATVLILGLMFGYAVSAFVTLLVAGTEPEQLQRWMAWGFGSFTGVTWQKLRVFAPVVFVGVLIAGATTKQLDALLLGENYARSMGLPVRRMRVLTMAGASLLGGVVTAFCGPISFLGIAIPHLCRALLGTSDHRALVPATVMMGGILALVAQLVALLSGSAGVLPLNAVTALLGAPVVVFVLLRARRGAFTG